MIFGMDDAELQAFIERISATSIANQAILMCCLNGVPLSRDNVMQFVDGFIDPTRPVCVALKDKVAKAIDEVLEIPGPSVD